MLEVLREFDTVLNVIPFEEGSVPPEIQAMAEERVAARAARDWATADALRDKIHAAGYEIEDTTTGMRVVPR